MDILKPVTEVWGEKSDIEDETDSPFWTLLNIQSAKCCRMLCLELQTGPQICKGYTYHTEDTQCLLKHGTILHEQRDISYHVNSDIQYGS